MILYYGTRYPRKILEKNRLEIAPYGDTHLSLTTSISVAIYWATMSRDDDEGIGAVFEFKPSFKPFVSVNACIDGHEHKMACKEDIVSLLDYVQRIDFY